MMIEPIEIGLLNDILSASLRNPIFIILILVILGDVATGWAKNSMFHTGNSSAGIKGLIKHSTVLFISLIFSFIGALLQSKTSVIFADVFILAFAFEYAKSIIENFGVMGFRYPKMLSYKVEEEIQEKLKLKEEAEKMKGERNNE